MKTKQFFDKRAKATINLFMLVLIVATFFFSPNIAQAQAEYVPLTPVQQFSDNGACDPNQPTSETNCQINIVEYIPRVFKLAVAIAGGLAVLMIMLGGIKYITSASMGGKEDGKEMITNAILGLLLAIGAYLILYTINPDALEFNLSKISKIPATGTPIPPGPEPEPNTCSFVSSCNRSTCYNSCPEGSAWPSDVSERLQLTGINFNNANCQTVGAPGEGGCTSVFMLPQSAINNLLALKNACNCSITITGGTEFWSHASHGPMLPKVDLRYIANDALDTYIRANGTMAPTCVTGSPAWSVGGHIYVLEGNHWHVCN